ncbi:3-deoxy-7-phosphoheptulonate synthase [Streptomyces sioyaensis]|uniref:3-deoxy-7-phosphoheptulonate synthase n=1 Tax=Streptomyces sioyaensis TaxID=67364 RepID=UPI003791E4CF
MPHHRVLRSTPGEQRTVLLVPAGEEFPATPDEVTECVADPAGADRVGEAYTSLCDPRLNPSQAVSVVAAWQN